MLVFSLDNESGKPLYQQIYEYIKEEIMQGRLSYREKLPSARELAASLLVSRNPVDTAYEQLVAEGYVYAVAQKGYYVNEITYIREYSGQKEDSPAPEEEKIPVCRKYNFNPDEVDSSHFPYAVFRSIARNVMDREDFLSSGNAQGDRQFRSQVAKYLYRSRGVQCELSQIVIGAGIGYLLQLLSVLFRKNRKIAFEEPGYVRAKEIFASYGFDVVNVEIAEKTITPEELDRAQTSLCYLTPSHQFPLGTVMPAPERQRLLKWAREKEGRYLIEDDHDSEYRYKGKPIPAMQSLDPEGKVIYIGTFSKVITPALRLGYMVLPKELVSLFHRECGAYNCPVSRLDQQIVTAFMSEGHFDKHLNRMRKIYWEKHDVMLSELQKYPEKVKVHGDYAGLYVIVEVLTGKKEEQMIWEAEKKDIYLRPLSVYYKNAEEVGKPAFLLGFAVPDTETIKRGIFLLCEEIF